jgi:predicted nucleic acid-binding protein
MIDMIRPHYLDASALVKLIAKDDSEKDGRDAVVSYYRRKTASVWATSYSIAETLSVFKGMHKGKRITLDEYLDYVRRFLQTIVGQNLREDKQMSVLSPAVRDEAERLIKTYPIDFLDAFQLVTIMQGKWRNFRGKSKPLLITADKKLSAAARAEGLDAWDCINEPAPD